MQAKETSETQAKLPAGVYRHRESGQELVAQETGQFGNPQADAFVRMGFEYIGPLKKDAIAEKQQGKPGKLSLAADPFALPEHNVVDQSETAGALEARLAAAKARDADARRNAEHSASLAEEPKKESAPKSAKSEKENK